MEPARLMLVVAVACTAAPDPVIDVGAPDVGTTTVDAGGEDAGSTQPTCIKFRILRKDGSSVVAAAGAIVEVVGTGRRAAISPARGRYK